MRPESNNNVTITKPKSGDDLSAIIDLDKKPTIDADGISVNAIPIPTAAMVRTSLVDVLTAACGEKILNPDFLLQGGDQPFANDRQSHSGNDGDGDEKLLASELKVQAALKEIKREADDAAAAISKTTTPMDIQHMGNGDKENERQMNESNGATYDDIKPPVITLYSQKMKGLKDLLLAEKLNTHAISLQVTAQSQVQVGGKKTRSSIYSSTTSKRTRRD